MKFADFDLPDPVMAGIQACGFETCTPIQAQTLPHTLRGRDVAGQAQTGTGKTAAFLIAGFTHLLTHPEPSIPRNSEGRPHKGSAPRMLVVAPTRELVAQIEQDAHRLGDPIGFTQLAVFGGVHYEQQRSLLQSGHIDVLIGTPGRLIDYYRQHAYTLGRAQVLVVDEADRMFDMGFITDLRFLLRRLPPPEQRLSMLYSATLSYRAQELSYEFMNDALVITTVTDSITVDQVRQRLFHVSGRQKLSLLLGILGQELGLPVKPVETTPSGGASVPDPSGDAVPPHPSAAHVSADPPPTATQIPDNHTEQENPAILDIPEPSPIDKAASEPVVATIAEAEVVVPAVSGSRVMLFVNTKRIGEHVCAVVASHGVSVGYLSGDVRQRHRMQTLKAFQEGKMPLLIATDVASRGLHIDGVTHVINYDLPENPEDYVHRIGRTARAGAAGEAITLVDETGAFHLEAVETFIEARIPAEPHDDTLFFPVNAVRRPPSSDARRVSARSKRRPGERSGRRDETTTSRTKQSSSRPRRRNKGNGGAATGTTAESQALAAPVTMAVSGTTETSHPVGTSPTVAPGTRKRRRRKRRRSRAVIAGPPASPSASEGDVT